jgi:hypothetical protein
MVGLRVRIPPGAWTPVGSECRVLSGRSPCDRLFIRPEKSYRMSCVWMWSWSLDNEDVQAPLVTVWPWGEKTGTVHNCASSPPLFHIVPRRNWGTCDAVGRASLFHVAILQQLFQPRDCIFTCRRQDLVSTLGTSDNRTSPDQGCWWNAAKFFGCEILRHENLFYGSFS